MKRIFLLVGLLLLMLISGVPLRASQGVNAQTDDSYGYLFPIFLNLDPHYAKFSSIGPDGGTVASVTIDPRNKNVLYAGTWGSGIYKSLDGGDSWTPKNIGLPAGFVFDIAIDHANSQHLLATVYRFGIYQSFDGGNSWTQTTGLPESAVAYVIKYDPSNSQIVYAAVRLKTVYTPSLHYPGGVYRSSDGGRTWVEKSSGLPDDYVYDVAIDPNSPNVLYAAMHETGVYKSVDGAGYWQSSNNNIHYKDVRSVDINPVNSDVYAGLYDGRGVAYSSDGGNSWTQISSAVAQGLSIYQLQIPSTDPKTLYLSTSSGLYRCRGNPYPSGSSTCERFAHPNQYVYDLALDLTSTNGAGDISRMYSGIENFGLFKSLDAGASFTASYAGIKSNIILSILNDPLNPNVLYASAYKKGVFKSMDAGETWVRSSTGLTDNVINQLIFRPEDTSVIYAASQKAGLFISEDSGSSWSQANGGLSRSSIGGEMPEGAEEEGFSQFGSEIAYAWMDPIDFEAFVVSDDDPDEIKDLANYPEILSISIDPSNPAHMAMGTTGYGIFRSNDYGATWLSTNLTWGDGFDLMVDITQSPNIFYAGVSDSGLRFSDVTRIPWPMRNVGMHASADVYGLTRSLSGKYYAATDSGIYQSNNAGETWVSAGLSGIRFNDVMSDLDAANIVWAASSDGLYRSLDNGQSWFWLGRQNLTNQFLTIAPGYGAYPVYFGTGGGNIYRLEP